MTSNVGSSIISALGSGSGINTSALVSGLVAAVRDPKEALITNNQSLNNTRISAMASAIGSLDTFSTTLTDLLKSTAYSGQPASTDPTIASVSTLTGGKPSGLPAQIEVQQLAQAQVLKSSTLASASTAAGQGTLTLTTPAGAFTITVDGTNNSLTGLAQAINNASAGVTATVMTDADGSRLVLKGATGEANAFTLTKEATDTADADLERFTFDGVAGPMTQTQPAQNAIVKLDGVQMEYADNVIKDAIPYLRIDLNKAAPGTTVTLATDEPTATISDLLKDFVSAYNTLRSSLNNASAAGSETAKAGALASDSGIRQMKTMLAKLTTTQLATSGTYRTLSDIGISTNNDGTLKLNEDKLKAAFEADPSGVSQLVNPTTSTPDTLGLAAAVSNIKDTLKAEDGPLTVAKSRYEVLAKEYAKQMEKLDREMSDYEARLSSVYSALDTQLTALKATQSYLEQQVKAWNRSED